MTRVSEDDISEPEWDQISVYLACVETFTLGGAVGAQYPDRVAPIFLEVAPDGTEVLYQHARSELRLWMSKMGDTLETVDDTPLLKDLGHGDLKEELEYMPTDQAISTVVAAFLQGCLFGGEYPALYRRLLVGGDAPVGEGDDAPSAENVLGAARAILEEYERTVRKL